MILINITGLYNRKKMEQNAFIECFRNEIA